MGLWAVIAAHVLFNIAVVALLVRARLQGMDRSLVEASEDLYATPFGTFRQVVLPLLAPAILAGFLLAFTFSFEDFIIAFFVAGPDITLPIYVFSSIRRGVTPEINAVGTVVLVTSLAAAGDCANDPAARQHAAQECRGLNVPSAGVLVHHLDKAVEEVVRVLRAGRGFRVMLHREHRLALHLNAGVGAVEQRDVGFLHA